VNTINFILVIGIFVTAVIVVITAFAILCQKFSHWLNAGNQKPLTNNWPPPKR